MTEAGGPLDTSYRITKIRVCRSWPGWSATAVLEDLGDDPYPGFALQEGPYFSLTHKRAWRKALKAHGGRLW